MKKFVSVALLTLIAAQSAAAPLGMAQAGSTYQVVREQESLAVDPQGSVSINGNDQIVADQSNVRLRMLNGDLLVVGKQSSATLVDAGTVRVLNGQVLVAAKTGSQPAVLFHDLTVRPLVAAQQDLTFAVNALDENTFQVANYSAEMLAVTNGAGEQIALVTNKDVMSFTKGQDGRWGVSAIPMLALQGQESNAEDPASTPPTEEDDGDRDEAIAWWWIPVGAVAVGGAGLGAYYLIEENDDILGDNIRETFGGDDDGDEGDDDDDDNEGPDRPTRSPIEDNNNDDTLTR